MTKPPPPVFTGPIVEQPAGPRKKRTGLAIVLILVAVLCIGGAVVAVILLTGGKASMAITSPSAGSTVDGNSVKVRISLSGAGGVDKVEVFVDSEKRATIKVAPYQVTLESVDNGKHVLEASAVDANGSVLARASGTFTSHGKTDKPPDGGQTGDEGSTVYKAALASKINQASGLNARIARDADRVNTEVNFNARVMPAPLLAEIKSLNASAGSLAATANSPAPPADMKDLQSQFATLSEYLRVRADALLKGLQAVDSGGDYTAEFNRGAAAKASFDAAWPSFLTTCRSLGVPI
jgi:Bacterial Ig domain